MFYFASEERAGGVEVADRVVFGVCCLWYLAYVVCGIRCLAYMGGVCGIWTVFVVHSL